MQVRHAEKRDFDRVMEIYARARDFMAATGNPRQWSAADWPPEALVRKDIRDRHSYVCDADGRTVAVFYYRFGHDIEPNYRSIVDGSWIGDDTYGVVHRLASDGSVKGAGSYCLDWSFSRSNHLRVDTHGDNRIMQHMLEKGGFVRCGTVFVDEDDDPRLAYEKTGASLISAEARANDKRRIIALAGADNVRDLGGIVAADGRAVRSGLFVRGSALDGITAADQQILFAEHNISAVIDLRTGWERAARPNGLSGAVEQLWIPFFDQNEVGIEYDRPVPGTVKRGRDFACDPTDFYGAMANPLTVGQMRRVLHTLFDRGQRGLGTYYHCSGGKDRAGVTSFLLLMLLGVDRERALEDYRLTNVSRDAHIQPVYQRFLRLCGDEDRAWEITNEHRAKSENIETFLAAVDERYGSFDAFVRNQLGFSDEYLEQARDRCLCAPDEAANAAETLAGAVANEPSASER